ncbi:hypothetical protein [Fangia hongkongensis]|uniref:hypothetical protein n=1 Tax=Fangia hongkongensis TaxID=270495 RepID=UPI00036CD771|nr:hypothetical protein [Fangia hongkongensis]MBK2124632.1 hypothetical protein [Fangia hongkongensis]
MKPILALVAFAISCQFIAADSYTRLMLDKDSTPQNPSYFKCTISAQKSFANGGHPTLAKWTPPLEFTEVTLVNYAQNVKGFNGLGIINTTADYINTHYFAAYHDPDFKNVAGAKESKYFSGFIDGFVHWAGYSITCNIFNPKTNPTKRVLAGSDYN